MADGSIVLDLSLSNDELRKQLKNLEKEIDKMAAAKNKAASAKLPFEESMKRINKQIDEANAKMKKLRENPNLKKVLGKDGKYDSSVRKTAAGNVSALEKQLERETAAYKKLQEQMDAVNKSRQRQHELDTKQGEALSGIGSRMTKERARLNSLTAERTANGVEISKLNGRTDFASIQRRNELEERNLDIDRQIAEKQGLLEKLARDYEELEKFYLEELRKAEKGDLNQSEYDKLAQDLASQKRTTEGVGAWLDASRSELNDISGAEEDAKALNQQESVVAKLQEDWQKAAEKVNGYNSAIAEADAGMAELENEAGAVMQQLQEGVGGEAFMMMLSKIGAAVGGLAQKFFSLETAKKALDLLAKGFQTVLRAAKSLLKTTASLVKNFLSFVTLRNLFGGMSKAAQPMVMSFKNLLRTLIGFSIIKKIFSEAKKYVMGALETNEAYRTSLAALKGSLAAAFQPIYEAVAPAIIYLINLLNTVVQAIGRFIAALGGKSYSQMMQNAKALDAEKKALKGAGSAAKDAAKTIAAFDEINQLNGDKDSGGGGGGIEPTFDEKNLGGLSDAIKDFADTIRELFMSGQFAELGVYIGNQVNSILDRFNLEQAATVVGTWVNNIATILNSLIPTIKWRQLGHKLSVGLNYLLNTMDGELIGAVLAEKFGIGIRLLAGFVEGLEGTTTGQFLGDAIKGFATRLSLIIDQNFTDEFWTKLQSNITDGFDAFSVGFVIGLNNAVTTIIDQIPHIIATLGTIGESILGVINKSLDMLSAPETVMLQVWDDNGNQMSTRKNKWQQFADSIIEGFKGINWDSIISTSDEIINKLISGFNDFFTEGLDGVDWDGIGSKVGAFISGINWTQMLTGAGVNLSKLFTGFTSLLTKAIANTTWGDIGKAIVEGIASIEWAEILSGLGELLAVIGNGIIELLLGALDAVTGWGWAKAFHDLVNRQIEEATDEQAEELSESGSYYGQSGDGGRAMVSKSDAMAANFDANTDEIVDSSGKTITVIEDSIAEVAKIMDEFTNGIIDKQEALQKLMEVYGDDGIDGLNALEDAMRIIQNASPETFNDELLNTARDNWSQYGNWLGEGIAEGIEEGTPAAVTATKNMVKDVDNTAHDGLGIGSPSELMKQYGKWFVDGFAIGLDSFAEKTGPFLESVHAFVEDMVNTVLTGVNSVNTALSGMNLGKFGKSSVSNAISMGALAAFKGIPMAEGGVIPPNAPFVPIFGDQRSGYNIEAPEGLIRQIVREESRGGSGNMEALLSELIQLVGSMKIGDEAIAKAANRGNRTMSRALGR